MKKYVCKTSLMYMVTLPGGKVEQPPEKCYHCDKLQNYGEICECEECEVNDAE